MKHKLRLDSFVVEAPVQIQIWIFGSGSRLSQDERTPLRARCISARPQQARPGDIVLIRSMGRRTRLASHSRATRRFIMLLSPGELPYGYVTRRPLGRL